MVLGGLWHGAAWGFVLWGFIHGAGAGDRAARQRAHPGAGVAGVGVRLPRRGLRLGLLPGAELRDRRRRLRADLRGRLGYPLRSGRRDRDRSGHRAAAAARGARSSRCATGSRPSTPSPWPPGWPSTIIVVGSTDPRRRSSPLHLLPVLRPMSGMAPPPPPRGRHLTARDALYVVGDRRLPAGASSPAARCATPARRCRAAGSGRWCSPSASPPAGSPTSSRSRTSSPT